MTDQQAAQALALLARAVVGIERVAAALEARAPGPAADRRAGLVDALAECFGPGSPFGAAGVDDAALDFGPLAEALAGCIDTNAPGPARRVALGLLMADLARDGHLERVGDRRGSALYRLRG